AMAADNKGSALQTRFARRYSLGRKVGRAIGQGVWRTIRLWVAWHRQKFGRTHNVEPPCGGRIGPTRNPFPGRRGANPRSENAPVSLTQKRAATGRTNWRRWADL